MAERLVFDLLAKDEASKGFIAAGRAASAAADNVQGLAKRLDDISNKSAKARVGLAGNKEALAEIDKLDVKLLLVGKRRADPKIDLEGALKANLEIAGVSAALDRMSAKAKEGFAAAGRAALAADDDVMALAKRLDDISNKSAKARVGLDGNKEALAQLDKLDLSLLRTGRIVADPKIDLEGALKAAIEIKGIDAGLDKLSDKMKKVGFARFLAGISGAFSALASAAGTATPVLGLSAGALAVVAVAAGAAVIALGPLIAGLGVITVAMAGLAAVAIPMLSDLKTKMTTISTANDAFAAAARNVRTAIRASSLDLKLYREGMQGLPAPLQNAIRLLGDSSVTWQNLTKKQRDNVIAVSQNKDILKNLLPAQKTSLAALLASKAAYEDLSPAQKKIADSLHGLSSQWHLLSMAVQPDVMNMFANALKAVKELMPALYPIIRAAAQALARFFKNIADWLNSQSGKKFLFWLETQGPKDVKEFGKFLWSFARDAGQALLFLVNAGTYLDNQLKRKWADVKREASDLKQWLWADFTMKIWHFFTQTIPAAGDLLSAAIAASFLQIEIHALKLVSGILGAFARLPFGMGKPFAAARDAINRELVQIEGNYKRTIDRINADSARLHGHTVDIQFKFPAGTISRLHQLHPGGFAAGTPGAAPGLAWVGERGPELVHFRGGETVFNHQQSRRMAGYASGTLDSFSGRFPSARSIDRVGAALQGVIDRAVAGMQRMFGVISGPPGFGMATGPGSGALGGDAGANKALARRMFPFGADQWPSFDALEMAEAGYNRFAQNASGAYGIPQALPPTKMPFAAQAAGGSHAGAQLGWMFSYIACMPLDTRILTRRGWISHDEIQAGDETIGYNLESGRSEWTAITDVHRYADAPLVRLRNKTWTAVCTPDHRWLSSRLHKVDTRRRVSGVRDHSRQTSFRRDEFVAANSLTSFDSLRLAAPADAGDGPTISLGEAELLGWVMGDGSVSRYKSRTPGSTHWRTGTGSMTRIMLHQAKPEGVAAIDELLAQEGVLFSRHVGTPRGIATLPCVKWALRASYTAELLKRSEYDHADPVPFVLSLAASQREAFLRGVFGAEGSQGAPGMIYGRGPYPAQRTYSQADGPQQDAIVLALYLSGKRPALHDWSTASRATLGSRPGANIAEAKPFIGRAIKREDAGRAPVYCVTTDLGTWTARQGRQVFLTGNSRWGSPANAEANELAHHWYGKGVHATFRKPTLIGVGERGPERVDVTPGGGPQKIVLEIRAGHGETEQLLARLMQRYVRVHGGGDVQVALGS